MNVLKAVTDDLPELPEPVSSRELAAWGPTPDYYTADQMREYGAKCRLTGVDTSVLSRGGRMAYTP